MSKKSIAIKPFQNSKIGFAAYFHGRQIASSVSFDRLAKNARVKPLLGKEGLVIKHTVPEDIVAVY
ncbi:MAG: hypothetical protein Q8O43_08935 [Dehalococcoidia bacterium]|nr:hypothetical protein [Dehalococcoidia bacterium]